MTTETQSPVAPEKPARYFKGVRTDIAPLLLPAAKRIFEVGCGNGGTLRWLAELYPGAYRAGLEYSHSAAQQALQACDHVICGDVEHVDLPFPDGHFDLILALDVLEHLRDPWTTVTRLKALLAPGGALIVSIPNVAHYTIAWALLNGRWEYTASGLLDRTHLRFFVRKTAEDLLESAGLHVDRSETVLSLPNWLEPIYWSSTALGRRMLNRLPMFRVFHYLFLIRARLPETTPGAAPAARA